MANGKILLRTFSNSILIGNDIFPRISVYWGSVALLVEHSTHVQAKRLWVRFQQMSVV